MGEYHKINSIYKRDEKGQFIIGSWSRPEFEYLADNKWIFTEKVDGTNIRLYWDKTNLKIAGKTDRAQLPAKLVDAINNSNIRQKLSENYPDLEMIIYCEGYGAGIQKGGVYRPDQFVVCFDIKVGSLWLKRLDVEEICSKIGIDTVPIWGSGTIQKAIDATKIGFESKWGQFCAEGLVLRPACELLDRRGDRIITKIKCSDWR